MFRAADSDLEWPKKNGNTSETELPYKLFSSHTRSFINGRKYYNLEIVDYNITHFFRVTMM